MAIATIQPASAAVRKRKAHRKSRQGCSNCKLRRVKCDEAKPRCHKCLDYGVDCSYDAKPDGDLQLAAKGAFMLEIPQTSLLMAPSLDSTYLEMINKNLSDKYTDTPFLPYRMSFEDLATLKRFQTRTVCTIGTAGTYKTYQTEIVRLASCSPFLMHILLTLTLMHDRYIAKESKSSVAEAFHWYQGTALFNLTLSKPLKPHERDAVWASAALLGAIAFSAIEATNPEEAWPLRPPTRFDLDWLSISDGKKEIARLAYPDASDSVFYKAKCSGFIPLVDEIPLTGCNFDAFPVGFAELYELDENSNSNSNPYYRAAATLNMLVKMSCDHGTILSYLAFIGHVPGEYKLLLENKDPRALLLLAYWYAKLCEYKQWWVYKRALVECQAICIYLRRYHWQRIGMWKLLKVPVASCGLEGSEKMALPNLWFPT